jgi:hypothetical protein
MTAVNCPVCGSRVNQLAAACPECGANPRLSPDAALADFRARGLTVPLTREKRPWSRRRRLTVTLLSALTLAALLAPLWVGYFGPTAAVYGKTWRPWRSDYAVTPVDWQQGPGYPDRRIELQVDYRDPWPGDALSPGAQQLYYTVQRSSALLPWVVTGITTGG